MKGDFTRSTFKPEKHYKNVRMQQGRVQLDADWNEQIDIAEYKQETGTADIIGHTGGPFENAGFKITIKNDQGSSDIIIGTGNYYVDGILCENEQTISIDKQPDLPVEGVISAPGNLSEEPSQLSEGDYLVYLDVWQRHLTALEDPDIREVALGGPDTTTRIKNIWQVKLLYAGSDINCMSEIAEWNNLINPNKGKIKIRLNESNASVDPCSLTPKGGYNKLENQLYRIEVHDTGEKKDATLKYSRDNGSIVTKWLSRNKNELMVSNTGMDKTLNFAAGHWIELTDDNHELLGIPGVFARIAGVEENIITIDSETIYPANSSIDIKNFPKNPKIRRWDSESVIKLNAKKWIDIDHCGLEVNFSDGFYNSGDYWLIPARTSTSTEDSQFYFKMDTEEDPGGIKHHYTKLAIINFNGTTWTSKSDCRKLFPNLTDLTSLYYISGDGQEAMPGHELPQPIEVAVANGKWRIKGAFVKFEIVTSDGSGVLKVTGKPDASSHIVETNSDGIASCIWELGPLGSSDPRVKVILLDADETSGNILRDHPAIYFNANLSTADNVAYKSSCKETTPNTIHNLLIKDTPSSLKHTNLNYYTIKEVLDALLCKLKAKHIPYDPTNLSRWNDVNAEENTAAPDTVQKAIDALLENLHSEDISYPLPECNKTSYGSDTLRMLLENKIVLDDTGRVRIKSLWDALLCHLDAAKIPYNPQKEAERWNEVISQKSDLVKNFGGINADYVRGVAVDSFGNIVLTGTFSKTISFGSNTLTSESDTAVFLVKLTSNGEHIWSKKIELKTENSGQSVFVSNSNDIILVSTSTTSASTQPNDYSIIVTKYSSEGEQLWVTSFVSTKPSYGYTAVIDNDDNVIVSGFYQETLKYKDGETDKVLLKSNGKADIFLAKFTGETGRIIWANSYGSTKYDVVHSIGADSENNIVVTGFFQGSINFGKGVGKLKSQGKSDIFIAKFNSDGNYLWAQSYGGSRSDYGRGLVLDKQNNIYLTGYFQKEITFGNTDNTLISKEGYDIYLVKLSAEGKHLWSRSFTGTKSDFGHAITITTDGTIVLAGYYAGQLNFAEHVLVSRGETDAFLAFFNPDGNYLFSESIGGTEADMLTRIASGSDNSLVIAGTYRGIINITGIELDSLGQSDIYVARFSPPYSGPTTVQSAIDELLTELDSSDIAYQIPKCNTSLDSIRKYLFPSNYISTVQEVLNAILCRLNASTIPYDPTNSNQQNPGLGWDQIKTVQEAINKVSNLAGSENSIDEFHADGVVKNTNGELGFDVSVNPENPLEVIYTGGIAYVGGYRYVIAPGVISVNASTTHQTLVVNDKGQMEIFISKTDSKKFTSIAVISTYQGEITRIVDTRFDLTHVDNKVEQNFQRTAEARTDRRQFVPLLTYSIKGLKYVDGRDKNFELGTTKDFYNTDTNNIFSDGDNIWLCNLQGSTLRIPCSLQDKNDIEYISLTMGSRNAAYDGSYIWFNVTGTCVVIRLDPNNLECHFIKFPNTPWGITFDGDFMWFYDLKKPIVSLMDVETCQIVREITMDFPTKAFVFDGEYMWLSGQGNLLKVEKPWGDPQKVLESDFKPNQMVFDGSHIWISSSNNALMKVNATDNVYERVLENTIDNTHAITFDGMFIWALQRVTSGTILYKIDCQTNQLLGEKKLDGYLGQSLLVNGSHLWMTWERVVDSKSLRRTGFLKILV